MFKPNSNRGPQTSSPQASASRNNSASNKLPQLWTAPTFDNIANLLRTAQREPGRAVELPFSVPGNDTLFQIKVLQPESGDPEWTFLSGTLMGLNVVWSLPCIDVQLVHNLVESESTGKDSVDLISSNSFNRSSTGNIAFPISAAEEQAISQTLAGAATLMQAVTTNNNNEVITPNSPVGNQQQVSLEGDLEKLNLPAVLQSLTLSKTTGRLGIASVFGGADFFIVDGNLVHATTGETSGDHAVLEVLLWTSGKFKFFEQEKCTESSLTKRLETLLLEGYTLLDQHIYLKDVGLTMDSYLMQGYRNLSEMQFEQMASRGAPVSLALQKDFYLEIDSRTSLYEVLRRIPLAKAEWLPVIYNLIATGLVRISNENGAPEAAPVAKDIDETAIAAAIRPLNRSETDVFAYPVFQWFVKQELARYGMDAKAFSLMVFDLVTVKPDGYEIIPLSAARIALDRIKAMKREIDTMAHFETFDYALLLPQTAARSASIVAQRILERINSAPIPGLDQPVNIAFGIASCPQDGKTAGSLMAAAAEAKKQARRTSVSIVEYKSMT
jgi:hypothetical protein